MSLVTSSGDERIASAIDPTGLVVPGNGPDDAQTTTNIGHAPAPFACNICKRSYTRVDHLARHYRSHTREKPFPCEVCGKHFSRADLLRRHATGHNKGSNDKRKRQTSPSGRVSAACLACSSAKLKCGEEKPCSRCCQKGIECVTAGPDHGLHKRLQPNTESTKSIDYNQMQLTQEPQSLDDVAAQCQQQQSQPTPMSLNHSDTNATVPEYTDTLSVQPPNHALPDNGMFPEQQPMMDTMMSETWFPDDTSFGDLLANIMMPISPANVAPSTVSAGAPEPVIRDVLDFGIDASFDLDDIDFGLLNSYNMESVPIMPQPHLDDSSYPPSRGDDQQQGQAEVNQLSIDAFQRSLWRWTPGKLDQANGEQMNLSLPSDVGVPYQHTDRPCDERLGQSARDRIMAMLFNTYEQTALSRIVTQFPSIHILDCLMQDFLYLHASRSDTYIHIPSFRPNTMHPELVAVVVASGAVRSTIPVIRKLGFALQEAVRLAIPAAFERDNSTTRDLQMLQAYLTELEVSLWSGNKRKMEIAESHGLPMITMLRRSGRFKRHRPSPPVPNLEDPPAVLESKWHAWIEVESFKRLAYRMTIYDSQVSMSFLVPPMLTHAEISLGLPASSILWKAKTASLWRDAYLSQAGNTAHGRPTLMTCVHDAHALLEVYDQVDLPFSIDAILGVLWKLIWDANQLHAVAKQHSPRSATNTSLVSGHWQQDLSQTLRNFRMTIHDVEPLSPAALIIHEHLLLNIYVSFEELSLFAGKEGVQEARRVLPHLRRWVASKDSRQAAWHAGQILRDAQMLAPDTLRDFHAIALYHAGLALWAYGLLSNEVNDQQPWRPRAYSITNGRTSMGPPQAMDTVFLDGNETPDTQKFISLNRATPVIKNYPPSGKFTENQQPENATSLADPKAVMETVIKILHHNHGAGNGKPVPPLVENLTHLMQDLSRAATKINKRR